MKASLSLVTMLFLAVTTAFAQKATVVCERTLRNNAGDQLHQIANVFADSVGNALKRNYPVQLDGVTVDLICENGSMTLRYTTWLYECDPSVADYYFDRRGSFGLSASPAQAKADAEGRMNRQVMEATEKFDQMYGLRKDGGKRTNTWERTDAATNCVGFHGFIAETFFVVTRF